MASLILVERRDSCLQLVADVIGVVRRGTVAELRCQDEPLFREAVHQAENQPVIVGSHQELGQSVDCHLRERAVGISPEREDLAVRIRLEANQDDLGELVRGSIGR